MPRDVTPLTNALEDAPRRTERRVWLARRLEPPLERGPHEYGSGVEA